MNTVILLGNLGQTPELRQVGSGKSVLNFSLAVDRYRNESNDTCWFDVTVWGASAEHQARHLVKGSRVIVEGELNQRVWVDKDNNKRNSIEVIAHRIHWIDLKKPVLTSDGPPKNNTAE